MIEFNEYENCCGHMIISDLDSIDPIRGIQIQWGPVYSFGGGEKYAPLKKYLEKGEFVLGSYSWIGNHNQLAQGEALAKAFKQLGHKVTKVNLGKNRGTGNVLTMWISTKHAPKRAKKKAASNGKVAPPRLRTRGLRK